MPDGSVKTWGFNASGQLGDGTTTNRLAPIVVSLSTKVVEQVCAGGGHSAILFSDGIVHGWGATGSQHGLGHTNNVLVPTALPFTGISALSLGNGLTLLLSTEGEVFTTGDNNYAQVGNGTQVTPVSTPYKHTFPRPATMIQAGIIHSMAMLEDGYIYLWGNNIWKEMMRDGGVQITPYVPGIISDVVKLFSLSTTSIAIKKDGSVWTWGANECGQCGNGGNTNLTTPYQVFPPIY